VRTKSSFHATTMELLRSFPIIPLGVQSSHHGHSKQRLHPQFPMRVSA
jgi:hypothetical protein